MIGLRPLILRSDLIPYWNRTIIHLFRISHLLNDCRQYSSQKTRNENLDFVKEQGLQLLEKFTRDIGSKTKQRLLIDDTDTGPTSYQLREAGRIKSFVQEAIDQYTSRFGKRFCIDHEPIVIIDAEVTADLRQARVYWCIPFSALISPTLSVDALETITNKMQKILDDHGGILQGMVHTRMKSYHHHASIRFVPAESSFLRETLQENNI
jgi:ribosome-binding factor A